MSGQIHLTLSYQGPYTMPGANDPSLQERKSMGLRGCLLTAKGRLIRAIALSTDDSFSIRSELSHEAPSAQPQQLKTLHIALTEERPHLTITHLTVVHVQNPKAIFHPIQQAFAHQESEEKIPFEEPLELSSEEEATVQIVHDGQGNFSATCVKVEKASRPLLAAPQPATPSLEQTVALDLLKKSGITAPIYQEAVLRHRVPVALAHNLSSFHRKGALTPEICTLLQEARDQGEVTAALTELFGHPHLWSEENRRLVAIHPDPMGTLEALITLSQKEMISLETFRSIAICRNPRALAELLTYLKAQRLETHQEAILAVEDPKTAARALVALRTKEIFTEENITAVLQSQPDNRYAIALGLHKLQQRGILTAENRAALVSLNECHCPFAELLGQLHLAGLLTETNRRHVQGLTGREDAALLQVSQTATALQEANRLNQATFDAMLQAVSGQEELQGCFVWEWLNQAEDQTKAIQSHFQAPQTIPAEAIQPPARQSLLDSLLAVFRS